MKVCKLVSLVLIVVICVSLITGCSPERAQTGYQTIDNMTVYELGDALVRALEERFTYKTSSETLQAQVDELTKQVQGIQVADPE